MKAMAYIKKNACPDLALAEFTAEWKALSEADQAALRQWAVEEGQALGIDVELV